MHQATKRERSMPQADGDMDDLIIGAGLMAGAANVIMQLSWPEVGYGVYESRVESGRLFDHPYKRRRTTLSYLSIAALGTPEERKAYRDAVDVAHKQVFSTDASPVKYHAMNPELQLWVAACIYRGFEDTYQYFNGMLDPRTLDAAYKLSEQFGTTLQVREDMWPEDREAFEEYWQASLERIRIDEPVRQHLLAIAKLKFMPAPVSFLLGRFNLFVTTGFLPEHFRREMQLKWSARKQRRFERLMGLVGAVTRVLPRPLREFPYNYYLWDVRKRLRTGAPLV